MTPNTIVRCIDDRQSEGRLVKGRLYVLEEVFHGVGLTDNTPSIMNDDTHVRLLGVQAPVSDGVLPANCYWKSSRFEPINRKDLETELLAKVADKIVGGARG